MNKKRTIVDIGYFFDEQIKDPEELLSLQAATSGHYAILAAETELYVVRAFGKDYFKKEDGVEYRFFKAQNSKRWIPFQMHKFVRSLRPDVVIIHGFLNPLQVLFLRMRCKAVFVIQYHGSGVPFGVTGFLQKMVGLLIRNYSFTAKQQSLEFVEKGVISHSSQIHEIPEASTYKIKAEKKEARRQIQAAVTETIFLWVGRLDRNKDPLTVLAGLSQSIERDASIKFYMIFQENELLKEVENFLARSKNLKNQVELVGQLPPHQLDMYYSAADYFVLGSHHEGSGYALIEALSCGCIPVVTDIYSFRVLTDNGSLGVLWQTGDASSLAVAVEKVLKKDKAKESARIIDFFEKEISFKAIARKHLEMIKRIAVE